MLFRVLADLVVAVHALFVLFVALGVFAVARWPKLAWVHVPCALWGAGVAMLAAVCPLTPLENHLRGLAGQEGYSGGFIDAYVASLIYPSGLTREVQVALGVAVLVVNAAVYPWLVRRGRGRGSER